MRFARYLLCDALRPAQRGGPDSFYAEIVID
jgi:hypothetical protein